MNRRHRALSLAAAGAMLLSGCATSRTGAAQTSGAHRSPAMTAGMVMPDGSTMGTAAHPRAAASRAVPTPAEKMICGAETRSTIQKVLGLTTAPTSAATWRDHLYTCTYRLPVGILTVSVKQSPNPTAAKAYFHTHRATLGTTETLDGLGQGSYGAKTGTVVLIKDSDTLTVDATALPAVFGKQQSRRFDFAYELASDILGCWTEG